jgi:hypothetical protein
MAPSQSSIPSHKFQTSLKSAILVPFSAPAPSALQRQKSGARLSSVEFPTHDLPPAHWRLSQIRLLAEKFENYGICGNGTGSLRGLILQRSKIARIRVKQRTMGPRARPHLPVVRYASCAGLYWSWNSHGLLGFIVYCTNLYYLLLLRILDLRRSRFHPEQHLHGKGGNTANYEESNAFVPESKG